MLDAKVIIEEIESLGRRVALTPDQAELFKK